MAFVSDMGSGRKAGDTPPRLPNGWADPHPKTYKWVVPYPRSLVAVQAARSAEAFKDTLPPDVVGAGEDFLAGLEYLYGYPGPDGRLRPCAPTHLKAIPIQLFLMDELGELVVVAGGAPYKASPDMAYFANLWARKCRGDIA